MKGKATLELLIELEKMKEPLEWYRNHKDVTQYMAKTYINNVEALRYKGVGHMAQHYQDWYNNFAKDQHKKYGYWLEGNTVHKDKN